jgi:putative membrane protein insertion efficiency factor
MNIVRRTDRAGGRALALAVRAYQVSLGHWLGGNCRFYPSCSQYGVEALREHGALRGSWLTFKRVGKCHPLHDGGVDLVPQRMKKVSAR